MIDFTSSEPAFDPNNRISFLLDWELTMKCNLDCSYCKDDLYGGHDNSTKHPDKNQCIKSIDFMFEYVDLYMATKIKGIKHVILNVYGGESLHHPDIVEILHAVREKYEPYKNKWHLTVTTTTNAIISEKKIKKIIPLIDEFTVSYHPENTDKQKDQFKKNLLDISRSGKNIKCVVLMHQNDVFFKDSQIIIEWLNQNNIRVLPRQLDGVAGTSDKQRIYKKNQVIWFDNLYRSKSYNNSIKSLDTSDNASLTDVGRACCGGRQICLDQKYKTRHFFIPNKFPDWYCSVNHFFLYVKQINGEIFVNKDCKMNFDGSVGPIGNLKDSKKLLETLQKQLTNNSLPIIQCKKNKCLCGLCAPKSKSLEDYLKIMEKYQI